jgi:hypothetical protein
MRKYLLPILALLVLSTPVHSYWYRGASFGVSYLKVDDIDVFLEFRIKSSNDRKLKENGLFLGLRGFL